MPGKSSGLAGNSGGPPARAFVLIPGSKPTPTQLRDRSSMFPRCTRSLTTFIATHCASPPWTSLNRQLRSGVDDAVLAELVIALRDEDRLCLTEDQEPEAQDPRIICSLGLFESANIPPERDQTGPSAHSFSIVTVSTGHEASWSRNEIYNDDGR